MDEESKLVRFSWDLEDVVPYGIALIFAAMRHPERSVEILRSENAIRHDPHGVEFLFAVVGKQKRQ